MLQNEQLDKVKKQSSKLIGTYYENVPKWNKGTSNNRFSRFPMVVVCYGQTTGFLCGLFNHFCLGY